jgi:transcriptional regulator with XRE-family HTH domain
VAQEVRTRNLKKMKAFGENLKRIRTKKGLSQEDLAHNAEIAYTTINKIENGQLNTGICTVFELAKALNVAPKDLFDF